MSPVKHTTCEINLCGYVPYHIEVESNQGTRITNKSGINGVLDYSLTNIRYNQA